MRTPHIERPHPADMGGTQRLYRFANGLGASVIRAAFSYGAERGLWEMAMLRYVEGDEFELVTDSAVFPYTVEGWLDDTQVDALLAVIEALPKER